jgi:hypothetical protein
MICTLTNYYLGDQIKNNEMGGGGGHTTLWWGNLREGDHLEDLGINRRIILKFVFKMWDGREWSGLIWLRIGTGGGLL